MPPDEFKAYETIAYAKGFLMVSASPLTRSSHHAGEDFARLQGRARLPRVALMPQFRTKRRVRHTAADMFDLVADMERYPEFVPLCQSMRVRRRTPERGGDRDRRRRHDGRLQAGARDLHQPRDARPAEPADPGRISRRPVQPDGEPLGFPSRRRTACEVEFFISYEFRSRMLAMLMGAMFDAAFRRFSAAFERRADKVYGRVHRTPPDLA